MKIYRHKDLTNLYFWEVRYGLISDGTYEAVYKCINPNVNNITFKGVSEESIQTQLNAIFEQADLPKPEGYAFALKPIRVNLVCPICRHNLTYKPDHLASQEHYMHKCPNCGYEYEMPYVYSGQIVWAETTSSVECAIDDYNLDELKYIANTKPEVYGI